MWASVRRAHPERRTVAMAIKDFILRRSVVKSCISERRWISSVEKEGLG